MAKKEHTERRSEEFQEILEEIPSSIQRWGLGVILSILLLGLAGSAVFKYPDTISASLTLTAEQPAASVMVRTLGKLKELNVKNHQLVTAGTYLAVMENPATTSDILLLREYLNAWQPPDEEGPLPELPPQNLNIGDLQSLYSSFCLTLTEYREFRKLEYYPSKIRITREQLQKYQTHHQSLVRQQEMTVRQAQLAGRQYRGDSLLHGRGLVSQEALENSENLYIQSRLTLEGTARSLEESEIQMTQLRSTLLDLEYQYNDNRFSLETRLSNEVNQLNALTRQWEISYALVAPVEGEVVMNGHWTENQNFAVGEILFSVLPQTDSEILGKALVPAVRSGKIAAGQKVNIRFVNFPDQEYGMVRGYVDHISPVPIMEGDMLCYTVEVSLPEGLRTNYRKELPYLPDMQAQADILTDDISLLERLIQPIRKIWKEGME